MSGRSERRSGGSRRPAPAVGVMILGVAGLLAVTVAVLAKSSPRRTGTNAAGVSGLAIQLAPGQTLCEPGEPVSAGTSAVRLDAGAPGPVGGRGPALGASVVDPAGRGVASGRLPAGWSPGLISVPLAPALRRDVAASVCLKNLGPGRVGLGGTVPAGSFVVQIDGQGLGGRVRLEYMRPKESWFAFLGALAHRLTIGKSRLLRHWAAPAAILLMLVAVGVALRTILLAERHA